MLNTTIDSKLLSSKSAVSNALSNSAIQAMLNSFGYTESILQEGMELCTTTDNLHSAQKKEYGEQYAATDELNELKVLANHQYIQDLRIARIALKGQRSTQESLLLSGRRKESLSGWLKQAKTFYTNALNTPEVLAGMGTYNRTQEHLEAGLTKVNAVEQAYAAQLKEKGEAQDATEKRDSAFDTMQEWMSDFKSIARIALESQPQYLEMLGIVKK